MTTEIDYERFVYDKKGYQTEEICIAAVSKNPFLLAGVLEQTPAICIAALKSVWIHEIYNLIDIPIEGELLKEINRLKLEKGAMGSILFPPTLEHGEEAHRLWCLKMTSNGMFDIEAHTKVSSFKFKKRK